VGALGYYLERENLATASISLIRFQTERIRPPRALWVPFELGRPYGAPNNPQFQTRVVRALLATLDAAQGPVLEDFDEDAPRSASGEDEEVWACPLELKAPTTSSELSLSQLEQAFVREVVQLRPWYDQAVADRGRTTVGVSRLEPDDGARFVTAFLSDDWPAPPHDDMPRGETLKHCCEDLRAYYFEAIAKQPGRTAATTPEIEDWFWNQTTAGVVFRKLDPVCRASDDEVMQHMGNYLLLPRSQSGSTGDGSDGRVNPQFQHGIA